MYQSYAVRPNNSKGRLFREDEVDHRSDYQRDRDRIIHSDAFRRLKHKSQVFIAHESDYFRTRLTHSIEVGQIARTISAALGLNIDLTEAISLAHDLGHTAFGHTGEEALNSCMQAFGGFDHNAQAIKIVTRLEKNYAKFDGLNLTWETLEGIAKHNGPLKDPHISIKHFNKIYDLGLNTFPGLEAQIASLSDDIAYNNHDIDDGFRAGFINLDDLKSIELLANIIDQISLEFKQIDDHMIVKELIRRLIGLMVDDLITETKKNLNIFSPKNVEDIRGNLKPVASFSDFFISQDKIIRDFLRSRVYGHISIESERINSKKVIEGLFSKLINNIDLLPDNLKKKCDIPKSKISARVVCDYIASMTDRSAVENHAILYGKDIMDQPGY